MDETRDFLEHPIHLLEFFKAGEHITIASVVPDLSLGIPSVVTDPNPCETTYNDSSKMISSVISGASQVLVHSG